MEAPPAHNFAGFRRHQDPENSKGSKAQNRRSRDCGKPEEQSGGKKEDGRGNFPCPEQHKEHQKVEENLQGWAEQLDIEINQRPVAGADQSCEDACLDSTKPSAQSEYEYGGAGSKQAAGDAADKWRSSEYTIEQREEAVVARGTKEGIRSQSGAGSQTPCPEVVHLLIHHQMLEERVQPVLGIEKGEPKGQGKEKDQNFRWKVPEA